MDTPDISLTTFRLSSTLECVFSQQQMLDRQEQMPLSKTKGLYEIKFIEFSRIGFLWEIKFVPPLLFHLARTYSSGATALLRLLCNQQWWWWLWQTHGQQKTALAQQRMAGSWGQKCVFSSLFRETSVTSVRYQPLPLLSRQSHGSLGTGCHPLFSQVVLLVPLSYQ